MAALALFVALSTGGAYAANTVFSTDIVDGEVKNPDVAASAIGPAKVADNSLSGTEMKNDSVGGRVVTGLTGADIVESSLGTVPRSSQAFSVSPGSVGTSGLATGAVTREKTADPVPWRYIGDPGEPAFKNGWSNYDTSPTHNSTYQHAAYMKDSFGVVHLRGLVKGGTIGQAIFTLQGDYCPWFFHAFPVLSNNALGRITVQFVQPHCDIYADFGSNAWISLEGVDYMEWPLASRGATGAATAEPSKTVHHGLTRSTR